MLAARVSRPTGPPPQFECLVGDGAGDDAAAAHVGVVAHATQEAVGDARRATRAFADFHRAVAFHLHAKQFARTQDDGGQFAFAVKLQMLADAEAVAQRRA